MAHRLAFRGGEPRNVRDHWLGHLRLDVGSGAFLSIAADLADHHDRVSLRIGLERLQAVDVRRPDDGVAADSHRSREADVPQFVHHLVRQCPGLGHQADPALGSDVGRDNAGVGLARRGHAGAVRPYDSGRVATGPGVRPERGGVVHRDALSDHDDQRHRRVHGLDHRVLRSGRRHEHHGHVGASLGHRLANGAEHRHGGAAEVDCLAGLARVGAADHVGARRDHARPVLTALRAGDALDDDPVLRRQEDRHLMLPSRPGWPARRHAAPPRP